MNAVFRTIPILGMILMMMLPSGITFEQTISRAMQVSTVQERPLMLLFIAKDCISCRPVQEYLEGDAIQEAVARRYVAAKVDINDFDGQACSEIYGIGKVPALVIVDAKGTIMYKVQGEISLDELSELIQEKAVEAERQVAAQPAPEDNRIQQPRQAAISSQESKDVAVKEVTEPAQDLDTPAIQGQEDASDAHRSDLKDPVTAASISHGELVRRQIAQTGKSYSLQLGFFSNHEYALRMKNKALERGIEGVEILPVQRDGKDFFRVLFGSYPTAQAADVSSAPLKESGFEVKVHRNRL